MQDHTPEKLIVKYLSKEATQGELEELNSWLESDPRHADILQEYKDAYNEKYSDEVAFDTTRGLDIINRKIDNHEIRHTATKKTNWWYGVAAALTILTASVAIFYFNMDLEDQKDRWS